MSHGVLPGHAEVRDPDFACFKIKGAALLRLNTVGAHDLLSSEDVATQHPPPASSQLIALFLSSLNAQRNHVLGVLEGLSEEELRRPVLPSGWSCLGLVQHLAIDVERFWFRAVIAGERTAIDELARVGGAWQLASDVRGEDVFDLYRQEKDRANAVITAVPLDSAPAWWPDFFGDWRLHDLREVILHVITETACHAGHLDAVRELIDGRRWLVLTE